MGKLVRPRARTWAGYSVLVIVCAALTPQLSLAAGCYPETDSGTVAARDCETALTLAANYVAAAKAADEPDCPFLCYNGQLSGTSGGCETNQYGTQIAWYSLTRNCYFWRSDRKRANDVPQTVSAPAATAADKHGKGARVVTDSDRDFGVEIKQKYVFGDSLKEFARSGKSPLDQ